MTCYLGQAPGIRLEALIDTGATGYSFINSSIVQSVCETLKISPLKLSKPKRLKTFEGKEVTSVTHTIHPTLTVQGHSESLCPMFIADIGNYSIILGTPWMKKHGVVIDVSEERLHFKKNHCQHGGTFYQNPPLIIELENPHPHIKDSSNKPLPKASIEKDSSTKPKYEIIKANNTAKDGNKKRKLKEIVDDHAEEDTNSSTKPKDKLDIAMVGAAPYKLLTKQSGAEVFAVTLEDIEYQLAKDTRAKDPEHIKNLLPEEYHDLIDVFSKEAADELPPRRDCDHKIELLEGHKGHGYSALYKMSKPELEELKKYLETNLKKEFIKPSSSINASPVLFVRKPNGGLRFCVDYRKLNAITKRDKYPMPLISDIIDRVIGAKFLTVLDIRQAFNRIRMGESSEELTTFITSLGAYQYNVLPFGLTGGPGTWQRYINEVLFDFLIDFCMAYMDDILIYSKTLKEHKKHVRQVLVRLREAGLQVDIEKSQFHKAEVKFLGLLVGINGIRMDPSKIQTILDWEVPRTLKYVQAFIGFCNFYRRFIRGFSKVAKPLHDLAKKNVQFKWTPECQHAFETLKERVTETPVLLHYNPEKQSYVECDTSDWTTGGVLSQKDDEGVLHPVAFFSKTLNPAECNYEIYDKELLAIIRCFEAWKPELEGTENPVQVLTDHKALEYFMTTKKLTRRQARWAEMLSEFNFEIVYRPGKQNDKADALTRRPNDKPEDDKDDRLQRQHQIILTPNRVDPKLRRGITLNCLEETRSLAEIVKEANISDQSGKDIRQALQEGKTKCNDQDIREFKEVDGILHWSNKMWIPNNEVLKAKLIKEIHDQPSSGHPGIHKTIELFKRNYQWPQMRRDIRRYIRNCHICHRAKIPRHRYQGFLRPLPIPNQPWKDIAMDFVVGLPVSSGFNAILMVIDRLSKLRHYIPCTTEEEGTSAKALALLFLQYVWKHHGLPDTIVSDRGTQFVSKFWTALCEILDIKAKLSTAFHPQTDGQSEIANQEMERYLRTYVNYQQNDWAKWLPIAEFAANANVSESIKMTPFFANLGYEPRMSFDQVKTKPENTRDRLEIGKARDIGDTLKKIWEFARHAMKESQWKQVEYANMHRQEGPEVKVGDKVWLSTRNIKTTRPSKKLDHKNIGPYSVLRVDDVSYKLDLPPSMGIHPVFHKNLLELVSNDPLEGQIPEPSPPVIIDNEEEYEVTDILDARKFRNRIQFKAAWKNCDPDNTWYNADGFENSAEIVEDFYRRYPNKPYWKPKRGSAS